MTRKGIWDLQDVRDKYLQGLWENSTSLFTWGSNTHGYLMRNNNNPGDSSSPHQVPGRKWIAVSTGRDQVFAAVRDDGTLWMGGGNDNGALGLNQPESTSPSSPIQIPGTTWSGIKVAGETVIANKSDGTLWGWGWNGNYGQLAQSNKTSYSSPVQIPGTTWTSEYSIGNAYVLAVKSDGTLWSWGRNNEGQLGLNNQTDYSSPKQVPGTTWDKVGGSNISSVATRTDGTMWTFGEAKDGSLGHNQSGAKYSSPKQVPGTTWSDPACCYESMGCIKTDGTLWTWGNAASGNLGHLNNTQYSSPRQVGADTTWAHLYGMSGNAPSDGTWLATKTDGTLWAWGSGGAKLGLLGVPGVRSSPRQVPGTGWQLNRHSFAVSTSTSIGLKTALTPSQL